MAGSPEPSLGEALVSLKVLALTACSGACNAVPVAATGGSPNSEGLAALKGNLAARASVPTSFAVAASLAAAVPGRFAGPLTVLRDELRVTLACGFGCIRVPGCLRVGVFFRFAIVAVLLQLRIFPLFRNLAV
jgi:hypothetical protein